MVEHRTEGLLRELLRAPNLLSLVRLPLGALAWVAPTSVPWILGLLAAAAISDVLDGVLARRLYRPDEEHIGTWLDPLCDKLFTVLTLSAVWVALRPPGWLALAALTRELLVAAFVCTWLVVPSLRGRALPWRALVGGKLTTVAQFALFGAVMLDLRPAWPWLAAAASGLGLVAVTQYAARLARVWWPRR